VVAGINAEVVAHRSDDPFASCVEWSMSDSTITYEQARLRLHDHLGENVCAGLQVRGESGCTAGRGCTNSKCVWSTSWRPAPLLPRRDRPGRRGGGLVSETASSGSAYTSPPTARKLSGTELELDAADTPLG